MGPLRVIGGLLDTHPLLWALAGDERLPAWLGRDIDADPGAFAISDVCFWEIAIKRSAGKLHAPDELPTIVGELGFDRVSITREQVWAVHDLPFHHRDPFDRLLIAQAQQLGVPIITADDAMSAYDVAVLW